MSDLPSLAMLCYSSTHYISQQWDDHIQMGSGSDQDLLEARACALRKQECSAVGFLNVSICSWGFSNQQLSCSEGAKTSETSTQGGQSSTATNIMYVGAQTPVLPQIKLINPVFMKHLIVTRAILDAAASGCIWPVIPESNLTYL